MSVLKAKWVNRGFMRGPFLPIYGSGAIVVLVFTLPFRTNAVFVFFAGMISATILEYFTGVAMEKLFHVRYWDYSNQRFNLNGYICVTSSLAWGVFSVVLTLYGHTIVERLAMKFNRNFLEVIVFLLTTYISIDMAESVREAFNLKEVLLSLEENSEEFRRIQKRFVVASAFYGGEIKERSEAGLRRINSALQTGKKEYQRMNALLKRNPHAVSKMHKEAFSQFMEFSDDEVVR